MKRARVGILISGRGSNMEALARAARDPTYPAEIVLVLSNRPEARGLAVARELGIATAVVDHKSYATRDAFEAEVERRLAGHDVAYVACAGFMRVLSEAFVSRWKGRIMNIHPSLLPAYRGLDTHLRALGDGVRIHGCTVHFLGVDVDAGPIIAQAAVPVLPGDTPASLADRVLKAEHRLYPAALARVVADRHHGLDYAAGAPLFVPPIDASKAS